MKKPFTPFILLAFTGILVSSCGNFTKLSLTKRHYRPGYFVDIVGSKHSSPIIATRMPVRSIPQISSSIVAKPESYTTPHAMVVISEKLYRSGKTTTTTVMQTTKHELINPFITSPNFILLNTKRISDSKSEGGGHHERNVNTSFVIVVLCAIFLPPIGVALMYGIHDYFWIDLILTLLFFFPGMIFALIVVLM
jgi:uncharacterized membrane protein YqaE (UPF0057 family)